MTRRLAFLLFTCTALHAEAAPWRLESGLPPAPPPGTPDPADPAKPAAPPAADEPVTATGVVHPSVLLGDFRLGVMGDAFVTLELDHKQGQWENEFELSRVQLGGFVAYKALAGIHVSLESIRSSSDRSYIGIDSDSLLPRFKYAFVEITPYKHWLSLRAGLIPDLLVPTVESSWDFRVQGPTGVERDGMFAPGDLGGTLEGSLPWGLGSIAVSYTNGEGINNREQNDGKNATVALHLAPLRHRAPSLLLHVLYRDGSIGNAGTNGPAANSRVAGGVTYAGTRLGAGAIGSYALGYLGHGDWTAAHATGWVRGELPYRFFLFGRGDLLWPDASAGGSFVTRLIGGVAWALPAIARLVVSYEGTLPTGNVENLVPAVNEHRLLFQVEGRL